MLKGIKNLILLLVLATNHQVFAKVSEAYIEQAIVDAAQKVGVPADVLHSICVTESNLKTDAFVFNDGGDDNHAFGMCQVLRETAEKYVGSDKNCRRDFRDTKLTRDAKACKLFGPRVNALVAAKYLKEQYDRYDGHTLKAVAAYNTGSLKACPKDGKVRNKERKVLYSCKKGDVANRRYIKRVQVFLADRSPELSEHLDIPVRFNKRTGAVID